MVKKLLVRGLHYGLIAGLLVTLFDGIFMLIPHTKVPSSYPLLLITFNVFSWMIVGMLSGFTLWVFVRKREGFQEKENFYWVLFFLSPFAIIYGVLGRLHIPLPFWAGVNTPSVFDHHLSFAWVSIILIFLVFYLKKSKIKERKSVSISFILEIATIILLFLFCSNLSRLSQDIPLGTIPLYSVSVLLIIGFYFFSFFKIRPFIKEKLANNNYVTSVILLFIVPCSLAGFYVLSHKNLIKWEGRLPVMASKQSQETVTIPRVILIVLDTVRSDRLSLYGHPGVTKNLQEFSRDSLVFENCVASSSWTIPSHASLFTGFYPTEHGSHGILDPEKRGIFGRPVTAPLSEKFATLAEIFEDNSYKTCAIVSNRIILSPELKLNQGFQISDYSWNIGRVDQRYPFRPSIHLFCFLTNIYPEHNVFYRTANEITRESISSLEKLPPPVFLFINYLDAHAPYSPPRPFAGYFLDTQFPQLYRLKQYFRRYVIKKWSKKSWDSYQLSQYDGEIAYLDDELGKFFSRLKQMGVYDSSLIIVTSDHGEHLGEHGLYWHGGPIYQGVAKIPLAIKFPYGKRVGREKRAITLADLYPTILSICNLPIPDGISGKAFGNSSSPVVSEVYEFTTWEHRVLYDGKYKYMNYGYKKDSELYNLDRDPTEQRNLAEKFPGIAKTMEGKLQDWKNTHKPKYISSSDREPTMSREMKEQLKALGYLQ